MAQIDRFEDLIAWQKARELHRAVHQLTRQFDRSRRLPITDQLQRAPLSVMSNIAEGFERDGVAEFRNFLTIAKGSCGETRSLLYAAFDAELIDDETLVRLKIQVEETSRVIAGLRNHVEAKLKRQRLKQPTV
ncbi:MAG TPA: four helix bundle protein [Thermomicrobiales bacterium]|jgi:four helix bundle protein